MTGLIGIVLIFVMVFGGFMLGGGHLETVFSALPFEMMIIAGAATGAFIIGNSPEVLRDAGRGLVRVFRGPRWQPGDYRDLLCLLFELIRLSRANPVALEEHVERPAGSAIFNRYPRIAADAEAVSLVCDTMRAASMNYDDPHQVEDMLEKRIEAHHHKLMRPVRALGTTADALPALGIVAAVLGVIKTMASIDQPPEVLGRLIAGALVGTFLGVFLAYGFVGPFAARLRAVIEDESHFYRLIREVLVANLHQHPPQICIEVGRQNTPDHNRPGFNDLEEALKATRDAA
ncbi:MAG: flagellar motor stator protein MotA [Rubellimicrobium sp.]|nr:flagellar motor stator protein MotA [Rubellimicrobium sp.]